MEEKLACWLISWCVVVLTMNYSLGIWGGPKHFPLTDNNNPVTPSVSIVHSLLPLTHPASIVVPVSNLRNLVPPSRQHVKYVHRLMRAPRSKLHVGAGKGEMGGESRSVRMQSGVDTATSEIVSNDLLPALFLGTLMAVVALMITGSAV